MSRKVNYRVQCKVANRPKLAMTPFNERLPDHPDTEFLITYSDELVV